MLTPEALNRVRTAKRLASAARNKPAVHPDAVRFLQKCTGDVAWLCDRLEKASKGQDDVESESLREDHEAMKSTLLSVCSRLDVDKIDEILPAIDALKLKTTEPDEIEDEDDEDDEEESFAASPGRYSDEDDD